MAFLPRGPLTLSGGCACKANKYTIRIPAVEDRALVAGAIDTPIGIDPDGKATTVPTRFPLVDIDHCDSCRRISGVIAQFWFICPTSWVNWDFAARDNPSGFSKPISSSDPQVRGSKGLLVNDCRDDGSGNGNGDDMLLSNVPSILAIGPPNPQQECEGTKSAAWTLGFSQPEVLKRASSLTHFRSSSNVTRTFCSRCGTNLTYYMDRPASVPIPPTVDITVGSLDAESIDLIRPDRHCWWNEGVSWVKQLLRNGDGGILIRHPGGNIGLEVTD